MSVRVVTLHPCTAWPEHSPFWAGLSAVWQVLHDDASTAPALIVIHSHLLGGVAASACSLPPFLPASDPHLPDARQGKVLSLNHLEDKRFTYMDTQLSRPTLSLSKCTMTLPLIPCILRYNFERTGRTQPHAGDVAPLSLRNAPEPDRSAAPLISLEVMFTNGRIHSLSSNQPRR